MPAVIPPIPILLSLSTQYANFVASIQNGDLLGMGDINTGDRITRPNVVPLLILLVLVIFYLLMTIVWPRLPFAWAITTIMNVCRHIRKRNKVHVDSRGFIYAADLVQLKDPLRTEISPYTGEYYKIIDYGTKKCCNCVASKDEITKEETEDGWKGLFKDGLLTKCKTFLKPSYIANQVRNIGAIKYTFEVVGDHGIYSYELSKIPAYKKAMLALQETVEAIMADELDGDVDWNHRYSRTKGKNLKKSVVEEYERKRKQRIIDEQKKKKVYFLMMGVSVCVYVMLCFCSLEICINYLLFCV